MANTTMRNKQKFTDEMMFTVARAQRDIIEQAVDAIRATNDSIYLVLCNGRDIAMNAVHNTEMIWKLREKLWDKMATNQAAITTLWNVLDANEI